FRTWREVSAYLDQEAPKVITQVPLITVAKGKVVVDAAMPYVIKDPRTSAPLVIIDTTGKITSLTGSEAAALLTGSTLLVRKSPSETRTFELSEIGDLVIDQSKLYEWTEIIKDNFVFVLYPLTLLFSFLFRTVQALIFAVIGMTFAKNLKLSLPFQAAVSLAIVAMTPALILSVVYSALGLKTSLWWLISFVISLGYLFFAVKAQSEDQTVG
ncbi:MAG TPA: DUF1189 family protein, partial [Thermodesulfovibrionales bacterium]|nr:DUF1189 family protein [Thermodesulfovibrionales bacterium]